MSKELDALSGVETPSLTEFWNWVKKTFTISYQSEVEAYLADSVDYKDFDNRMEVLRRRNMI